MFETPPSGPPQLPSDSCPRRLNQCLSRGITSGGPERHPPRAHASAAVRGISKVTSKTASRAIASSLCYGEPSSDPPSGGGQ